MAELHHPAQILRALAQDPSGQALVLLTDVRGGTLRARGAMMSVSEDGAVNGYISQGCVDADIIAQAREALENGKARRVVYGEGSTFSDITLPCGGRIELAILPRPDHKVLQKANQALTARQDITLGLSSDALLVWGASEQSFTYAPPLQLILAGRGAALRTLTNQARLIGLRVKTYSPEAEDFPLLSPIALSTPARLPIFPADKWSAGILLFHDHDWEPEILIQLLQSEAFYIGAMGSTRTHRARLDTLRGRGIDENALARIHGPIGHLSGLRDAGWLASSILAEIASAARAKGYL